MFTLTFLRFSIVVLRVSTMPLLFEPSYNQRLKMTMARKETKSRKRAKTLPQYDMPSNP